MSELFLAFSAAVSPQAGAVLVIIAGVAAFWTFGATRAQARTVSAEPATSSVTEKKIEALEHDLGIQTARLLEAQEQMESLKKAHLTFLGELSHALRIPMTTVVGYADLLQDATIDPEGRTAAVQGIRRAGHDLSCLLIDVADLAQMEAGVKPLAVSASPLPELLQETLHAGRERAVGTGLELELIVPERLPRAIITDADRLRQIIIALLSQAIDAADVGVVSMNVSCEQSQLRVIITYPRTVHGTQSEGLSDVPFAAGTSLSMVMAQRWARLLGGTLMARVGGQGASEFHLIVDAGNCEEIPQLPTKELFESVSSINRSAALRGMTVLLAEDVLDNQRLIVFLLRHAGAEVQVVTNGREAVAQALLAKSGGRPFDAILMDMSMPEMDGFEAARVLRQSHYRNPIIALTAHAMVGDRDKCLAAGCDAYMSKPLDRTRLITMLQNLRVTPPSVIAASKAS